MALAKTSGIHPEFRRRLEAAWEEWPLFDNRSGYRSPERQRELYEGWKAGKPGYNPANPPGTSNHEATYEGTPAALAADIHPDDGKSYGTMQAVCRRHEVHFPIAKEDWHAQPVEAKSGKFTGHVLGPPTVVVPYTPPAPIDEWEPFFVPVLVTS